jgi:hypothetical protein
LGKKQEPTISKTTRAKPDRYMPQAAEQLPSKHETLSSNPSTNKKKVSDIIKRD